MLLLGQAGYERWLAAESGLGAPAEGGPGWARWDAALPASSQADAVFPHAALTGESSHSSPAVNALAASIAEAFGAALRGRRLEEPWPLLVWCPGEAEGLSRRASHVAEACLELLRRRMGRVARLAQREAPRGPWSGFGLGLLFPSHQRVFASTELCLGGQRRMADDPAAPSRSYLKTEEAFVVLGEAPASGQSVVDLGAAPGGWSWSAAKRGARVLAVDNGPLKAAAAASPLIEHLREDAFRFSLPAAEVADWLFCDLVEEPHHVLELVSRWIAGGRCRRFVINLKFGRADPLRLLDEIRRPGPRSLAPHCELLRARHLFHDREEFTLVGRVRGA